MTKGRPRKCSGKSLLSVMLTRELGGSLHLSAMEKMFSSNINEANCVRMYILADSMQSVQLKKDAFEVINSKWDALLKNEDFRECIMNYPELVFEITEFRLEGVKKKVYVEKKVKIYVENCIK